MSEEVTETRTVVIDRELPHLPSKVWRALTQPDLIQEWLMKSDFMPIVGHLFDFRADWGSVHCQILVVEPDKALSYSWAAFGLESVVTWTLNPTSTGTHLRMEHSGFQPDQEQAYKGAQYGWQNFLSSLDIVLARID